jgi:hypothetical protein
VGDYKSDGSKGGMGKLERKTITKRDGLVCEFLPATNGSCFGLEHKKEV